MALADFLNGPKTSIQGGKVAAAAASPLVPVALLILLSFPLEFKFSVWLLRKKKVIFKTIPSSLPETAHLKKVGWMSFSHSSTKHRLTLHPTYFPVLWKWKVDGKFSLFCQHKWRQTTVLSCTKQADPPFFHASTHAEQQLCCKKEHGRRRSRNR